MEKRNDEKLMFIEPYALRGVTNESIKFVEEHIDKIGNVKEVYLTCPYLDHEKAVDEEDGWGTIIVGELGEIHCFGFAGGYTGEGARGFHWLLKDVLNTGASLAFVDALKPNEKHEFSLKIDVAFLRKAFKHAFNDNNNDREVDK